MKVRSSARPVVLLGVGALAAALVIGVVVLRSSPETEVVRFDPIAAPIANPERGWYDRIETILTARDFSESTRDGVTLLHSYVRLDDYRDEPIPDDVLAQLGEGLDAVRASGLKIVLRFAYNQGPYPDSEPDATEDRILEHVGQLGPVLQEHRDVIAGIEAGFVGAWGEWHTSTNGLDQDSAAKQTILDAERDAFPGQLLLRYPADLRALATDPDVPTGVHLDCFLSGDPDDNGTWSRDGSSPAEDKELVARAGESAIIGGETCNPDPPERTSCPVALEELAQMHFTYLNRDYEPNSLARLAPCADEIAARLGYRLELVSAELPATLDSSSSSTSLRLTIRNTGFAAPYQARPVQAVRTCGDQVERVDLDTDVRSWDPGREVVVDQRVTFADPPQGSACTLGIAMPDAESSLADDPAYAIRFASSTTWSGGVNDLGSIRVGDR